MGWTISPGRRAASASSAVANKYADVGLPTYRGPPSGLPTKRAGSLPVGLASRSVHPLSMCATALSPSLSPLPCDLVEHRVPELLELNSAVPSASDCHQCNLGEGEVAVLGVRVHALGDLHRRNGRYVTTPHFVVGHTLPTG